MRRFRAFWLLSLFSGSWLISAGAELLDVSKLELIEPAAQCSSLRERVIVFVTRFCGNARRAELYEAVKQQIPRSSWHKYSVFFAVGKRPPAAIDGASGDQQTCDEPERVFDTTKSLESVDAVGHQQQRRLLPSAVGLNTQGVEVSAVNEIAANMVTVTVEDVSHFTSRGDQAEIKSSSKNLTEVPSNAASTGQKVLNDHEVAIADDGVKEVAAVASNVSASPDKVNGEDKPAPSDAEAMELEPPDFAVDEVDRTQQYLPPNTSTDDAPAKLNAAILQGNYSDTYTSLAWKSASILNFLAKCKSTAAEVATNGSVTAKPPFKWYIKVDDDMVTWWGNLDMYLDAFDKATWALNNHALDLTSPRRNVPFKHRYQVKQILDYLNTHKMQYWWIGTVLHGSARLDSGKNAELEYNRDVYPQYMSGPFYMMGHDTVSAVVDEMFTNRTIYRNEDAQVGIWADNLRSRHPPEQEPIVLTDINEPGIATLAGYAAKGTLNKLNNFPFDQGMMISQNRIGGLLEKPYTFPDKAVELIRNQTDSNIINKQLDPTPKDPEFWSFHVMYQIMELAAARLQIHL